MITTSPATEPWSSSADILKQLFAPDFTRLFSDPLATTLTAVALANVVVTFFLLTDPRGHRYRAARVINITVAGVLAMLWLLPDPKAATFALATLLFVFSSLLLMWRILVVLPRRSVDLNVDDRSSSDAVSTRHHLGERGAP